MVLFVCFLMVLRPRAKGWLEARIVETQTWGFGSHPRPDSRAAAPEPHHPPPPRALTGSRSACGRIVGVVPSQGSGEVNSHRIPGELGKGCVKDTGGWAPGQWHANRRMGTDGSPLPNKKKKGA